MIPIDGYFLHLIYNDIVKVYAKTQLVSNFPILMPLFSNLTKLIYYIEVGNHRTSLFVICHILIFFVKTFTLKRKKLRKLIMTSLKLFIKYFKSQIIY